MRNFSTKKHLFRPLNHLLYHYQQQNPTAFRNRPNWRPPTTTPQQPGPTTAFSPHDQCQPKPYLGRCQACGTQGYRPPHPGNHEPIMLFLATTLLLLGLDSGASHHVTSDLSNLSLHSRIKDLMIS
ncbi:hypothetical protein CK203_030755 [Vitis vinifera]|uniref:Uncharacterized protein n=1 Tax=Vitis vinifera TaxID=29760 RepID=A0A438IRM1_VITVI|nr:hypothetical protein CK203_030755 [Vitis vinifera]